MAEDKIAPSGFARDAPMDNGSPGPFKHGRAGAPFGNDVMTRTFMTFLA